MFMTPNPIANEIIAASQEDEDAGPAGGAASKTLQSIIELSDDDEDREMQDVTRAGLKRPSIPNAEIRGEDDDAPSPAKRQRTESREGSAADDGPSGA
jgi:hypothetical protein